MASLLVRPVGNDPGQQASYRPHASWQKAPADRKRYDSHEIGKGAEVGTRERVDRNGSSSAEKSTMS